MNQPDTRTPTLITAHATLARHALAGARRRAGLSQAGNDDHHYYATLDFGGLFYFELNTSFANESDTKRTLAIYHGRGGGAAMGAGAIVGSASFARPIESLIGSDASFEINLFPFIVNANWWNDKGPLGAFVGGGVAIATGMAGGSGSFSHPLLSDGPTNDWKAR